MEITASVTSIKDLFNRTSPIIVPSFQRPYAWEEKDALILLDDLHRAWKSSKNSYFLGQMVITEKKPDIFVIDGQQRLTTLCIIFSALISHLTSKNTITVDRTDQLIELLWIKGTDESDQRTYTERILLKNSDRASLSRIMPQLKPRPTVTSKNQDLITKNYKELYEVLDEKVQEEDNLDDFTTFIRTKCQVVLVTINERPADDISDAITVFSVMNSRGRELATQDLVKSFFLENIKKRHDEYQDLWDNMEDSLERAGVEELLEQAKYLFNSGKYIDTSYPYHEAYKNMLNGKTEEDTCKLLDELFDYKNLYRSIIDKDEILNFCSNYGKDRDNLAKPLVGLKSLYDFNMQWLPLAMECIRANKGDPVRLTNILQLIDTRASYIYLMNDNRDQRRTWFYNLLKNYFNKTVPIEQQLELTTAEKEEFRAYLTSSGFDNRKDRTKYILKRLNEMYAKTPGITIGHNFSIEHILPQNADKWDTSVWSVDDKQQWVSRLANLVVIDKAFNSELQNEPFDRKKQLFKDKKLHDDWYPLAHDAFFAKDWTPTILQKREEELLTKFSDQWLIGLDDESVESKAKKSTKKGKQNPSNYASVKSSADGSSRCDVCPSTLTTEQNIEQPNDSEITNHDAFWTELDGRLEKLGASFRPGKPQGGTRNIMFDSKKKAHFIVSLVNKSHLVRVALYIKDDKGLFDSLAESKAQIEAAAGSPLDWERKDNRKNSEISVTVPGLELNDRQRYPELCDEIADKLVSLHSAFAPHIIGQ